ncbi:hypothetical protein OBV_18110 [Oscillibacter valericigenes Sjm18-20]|nr:hypothetical protein OBV_18110 [Oscillibacter valericigenes Sjm18-20]
MADYAFYTGTYHGGSIPETDFPRFAARAGEQLARYKRIYTVTAPETDSESMATCAMADALYYFETVQNAPQSVSIGSVSSSRGTAVDISPRAQSKELYRCACLYLNIYRGVD